MTHLEAYKKHFYEVLVEHLGSVHKGYDQRKAFAVFRRYIRMSQSGFGRFAHTEITLWLDSEPLQAYTPPSPIFRQCGAQVHDR